MQALGPTLRCAPCMDSAEIAFSVRELLDIRRDMASDLGVSALEAIKVGGYTTRSGRWVDWKAAVEHAKASKRSIRPEDRLTQPALGSIAETIVQVCNETTLRACKRFADRGLRPLALNLANGISPGGGFLNGARAQEEALCRASALYATLVGDSMYEFHRGRPEPDSSDWMILSPEVPIFRDDSGTAQETPWLLDILTSAAPYAPAVGQPRSGDLLQKRIHRALAVASSYGYEVLVLGAWGCGAFGNGPDRTARDFREALEGEYRGRFSEVVFAITDWSPERRFLGPFRDVFHSELGVLPPHAAIGGEGDSAAGTTGGGGEFELERFVAAQALDYERALAELQSGRKHTHWMWYVLPQLRGLGSSRASHQFGISTLEEARAYLAQPLLGGRLRACVEAILQHRETPIKNILGDVDALKYRSCLTLFHRAGGAPALFEASLQAFFRGEECRLTLKLLGETRIGPIA